MNNIKEKCKLIYKFRNDSYLAVLNDGFEYEGTSVVEAVNGEELDQKLTEVTKVDYNPYHDKRGRFTSKAGGGGSAVSGGAGKRANVKAMSGKMGRKLGDLEVAAGLSNMGKTNLEDADKKWGESFGLTGKGDLLSSHMDKNGKLKLSREILHRRLVAKHFEGVEKAQGQATMTFLGGGSAAGKSTFTKNPNSGFPSDKQAVKVDPDAIKGMLPEYKSMVRKGNDRAASYSHEESSAIAKRVIDVAQRNGYNVVLDGTGDNSVKSMVKKIDQARNAGLKVEGVYCTCPTQVAIDRSTARAAKTGRKVPIDKIKGIHKNVSAILPEIADRFDSVKLYDTSTNDAVLVASATRGNKLTAHNEALYNDFIAKASE